VSPVLRPGIAQKRAARNRGLAGRATLRQARQMLRRRFGMRLPRFPRRALPALALGLLARPALAQDRPLRLLVGFPPGGTLDVIARLLAEPLQRDLGRAVIVENRPGGGGRIAAEALAREATDGSVAMLAPNVVTGFFPFLYARLPFDPMADLAPVTMLTDFKFGLAVRAEGAPPDLRGFVAAMKARADGGNYGSLSAGTPSHFLGVLLSREAGLRMQHVPYRGSAPLVAALLAGEVQAGFDNTASLIPLLRDNRLRCLAVTGAGRSPNLPDVPTFAEAGLALGEVERAEFWYGVFASGRTPPDAVAALAAATGRALREPALAARLQALDLVPRPMVPAAFAAAVRADNERWGPVIRATGFTLAD
jgi:tripartite-type tricarboxylate transporter receptor subunit TctC